jgi:hypothetical protein
MIQIYKEMEQNLYKHEKSEDRKESYSLDTILLKYEQYNGRFLLRMTALL